MRPTWSCGPPNQEKRDHQYSSAMHQHHDTILSSNEGYITLAIQAFKKDASLSMREATKLYNVPRMTVRRRRAGTISQRDYTSLTKKLTQSEESVMVKRVLNLDLRGFPPIKAIVRDMANKLLAERGGNLVSINWLDAFIKRTPKLKT